MKESSRFWILDFGFWIEVLNLWRSFCEEDFSGRKGGEWV